MTKVSLIAEQFTIEGSVEYVVYFDDGSVQTFKDYPTEEQLNG